MRTPTLEAFLRLQQSHLARYGIVSLDPPIFYLQPTLDRRYDLAAAYRLLFPRLRGRPVYCLCGHSWALSVPVFDWLLTLEERCRASFPDLHLIQLCNEPGQAERLTDRGVRAVFCNHNCLADERVFRPLADVEKRFDAVYDARLDEGKRHFLAAEVASLALIHNPAVRAGEYLRQTREAFAHAHFFNRSASGQYCVLSAEEVNRSLNACRVGLCLSEVEGAMWASVQYLLSGLPVVTTPSRGGRDVFFDDRFVLTVPPEPRLIAEAVRELAGRALNPELIRQATLEKISVHRRRFVALVQEIYDENGTGRTFSDEWEKVFFHTMLRPQSHAETVELIRMAEAARGLPG